MRFRLPDSVFALAVVLLAGSCEEECPYNVDPCYSSASVSVHVPVPLDESTELNVRFCRNGQCFDGLVVRPSESTPPSQVVFESTNDVLAPCSGAVAAAEDGNTILWASWVAIPVEGDVFTLEVRGPSGQVLASEGGVAHPAPPMEAGCSGACTLVTFGSF